MNKVVKKVAAMAMAVMMMSTMAMSASALTISNSKNKLVYSGSETTTNYYVGYSKGTNKTSKKRYLYVSVIFMKESGTVLSSNSSEGVAKSNTYRECYDRYGSASIYRSYHRSIIKNSTSPTDTTLNVLYDYIKYVK